MFDPNKPVNLPNSDRLPEIELGSVSQAEFDAAVLSLARYSEESERRDFDEQNPEELESGETSSEQYLNIRKILAYFKAVG